MAIAQEDLEFIKQQLGAYVKENLSDWLAEQSLGKPPVVYEIELRERMVRVEEELRHQRELMQEGFAQVDKRFEQVDRRFEELREDMLGRFAQSDKRVEDMRQDMLARFDQSDRRFEAMTRRIDRFMIWSFGLVLGASGIVVSLIKFWHP